MTCCGLVEIDVQQRSWTSNRCLQRLLGTSASSQFKVCCEAASLFHLVERQAEIPDVNKRLYQRSAEDRQTHTASLRCVQCCMNLAWNQGAAMHHMFCMPTDSLETLTPGPRRLGSLMPMPHARCAGCVCVGPLQKPGLL